MRSYFVVAKPWEKVSSDICGQRRPRSDCAFAQSDQGLRCPQTECLDTTELINGEQRPEWEFAHVHDDVHAHIVRMLEGAFSAWCFPFLILSSSTDSLKKTSIFIISQKQIGIIIPNPIILSNRPFTWLITVVLDENIGFLPLWKCHQLGLCSKFIHH